MTTTLDGTVLDRADLLELLREFNADAKALSRRGYCGTATAAYEVAHDSINDCLTALAATEVR